MNASGDRRAERRELLVDLRHVAVLADAVGAHVLVDGDEVVGLARLLAHARRRRSWRRSRRRRSGPPAASGASARIAAVGKQPGQATSAAPAIASRLQLGQPVDGALDQLGMRVRHVPALVGRDVAQAEVGGEVDDPHARARAARRRAARRCRAGRRRSRRRTPPRGRGRAPRARAARGAAGRARAASARRPRAR